MKKKYDYALVSGGFDPVHVGHLRMFQDAKNLSDKVVLLLNNDEWLIKKKGKQFMNQNQRKEILDEFNLVLRHELIHLEQYVDDRFDFDDIEANEKEAYEREKKAMPWYRNITYKE